MKHGKGAKKARSSKKSPGKSSRKAEKKSKKESRSLKGAVTPRRPLPTRAGPSGRGAAAKGDGRAGRSATVTFTNPAVGNAFRRAVKKYSTALKRLTD